MSYTFKSIENDQLVVEEYNVEKRVSLDKIKWIKSSIEVNLQRALTWCITCILVFSSLSYLNYHYHLAERVIPKSDEQWIFSYPSGREVIQIGGKGNDIDDVYEANGRYHYKATNFRFIVYEVLLLPLLFGYIIFYGRYIGNKKKFTNDSHTIELGVTYGDDFKTMVIDSGNENETTMLLYQIRENHERVRLQ